jgi:hypothetical protein
MPHGILARRLWIETTATTEAQFRIWPDQRPGVGKRFDAGLSKETVDESAVVTFA